MKVVIAGDFIFPEGLAATSRVIEYALSLLEKQVDVKVISLLPTIFRRGPFSGIPGEGQHRGIPFCNIYGPARKTSFIQRRWFRFTESLSYLLELKQDGIPDAVILFSNRVSVMLASYLFSRLLGFSYIQEKSELPFAYKKLTLLGILYSRIFIRCMYKLPDGMIVISEKLKSFFQRYKRNRSCLAKIPILVDFDTFSTDTPRAIQNEEYIAFSGYIAPRKGLEYLIQCFFNVCRRFPDIKLLISGSGNTKYISELSSIIRKLGIADRIVFVGMLPADKLPGFMQNAKALIIPHPDYGSSAAAFPTKLGLYLSTGTPVITTPIGEISRYLTNREHAYITPFNNIEEFSENLCFVLNNPSEANRVGKNGREIARKYFSRHSQADRLLAFITQCCKQKGFCSD